MLPCPKPIEHRRSDNSQIRPRSGPRWLLAAPDTIYGWKVHYFGQRLSPLHLRRKGPGRGGRYPISAEANRWWYDTHFSRGGGVARGPRSSARRAADCGRERGQPCPRGDTSTRTCGHGCPRSLYPCNPQSVAPLQPECRSPARARERHAYRKPVVPDRIQDPLFRVFRVFSGLNRRFRFRRL